MGNNPTTIPQYFVSVSVSCLPFILYVCESGKSNTKRSASEFIEESVRGLRIRKTPECTMDIGYPSMYYCSFMETEQYCFLFF
jgi:hypothetical protein